MAKLTIAVLRKKWAAALLALTKIKARAANTPFGDTIDAVLKEITLEKSLNNYIILDKDHFDAPKVIGLLRDLGITPELLKERALADGLVNARVLEGGLIVEKETVLTDDNMVQLLKVLLFMDYEGDSQ